MAGIHAELFLNNLLCDFPSCDIEVFFCVFCMRNLCFISLCFVFAASIFLPTSNVIAFGKEFSYSNISTPNLQAFPQAIWEEPFFSVTLTYLSWKNDLLWSLYTNHNFLSLRGPILFKLSPVYSPGFCAFLYSSWL